MAHREGTEMIFLLAAAALLAGAPLVAAVLVSVASVREDAAKSLAGHPPGLLARAARRLLRANVGGTGPLLRPHRVSEAMAGGQQRWQPQRASGTGPVPAPRSSADDEGATRLHDALATPRN
jgi:hypothetical protein